MEHLTIDSSATRTAFIKNNKNTIFRDILVTNSHLPKTYRAERADYVVQVQLKGSLVSHVDTLNLVFSTALFKPAQRHQRGQGGYYDCLCL